MLDGDIRGLEHKLQTGAPYPGGQGGAAAAPMCGVGRDQFGLAGFAYRRNGVGAAHQVAEGGVLG